VRIVHDPTAADDLGADYLLVCPSTDPAWTPLFGRAAGLILERGGSLSHGAIVAREMGLPAVVLPHATTLLQEGETVTIDADRGRVARAGRIHEAPEAEDDRIPYHLIPPPPGRREGQANRRGLGAALVWGAVLLLMYILPSPWLKDPAFALLDALLWPGVRTVGMVATVWIVGALFALVPLLIQRFTADHHRLRIAKQRAATLQKSCTRWTKGSARRRAMLDHAAPVTLRNLKASMAALAWVLGPMMLVFFWMPARMDPAAWNADAGGLVTLMAELDGEYQEAVTLEVAEALSLADATPAAQSLPPIRQTLEALRREWQTASDLRDFPWELQTAADQAREIMLNSLNAYLAADIPPQTLTWRIRVPQDAQGHYRVTARLGEGVSFPLTLAFGNAAPPVPGTLIPNRSPLLSLEAVYPRPLRQRRFWTPLAVLGGSWDLGWLGAYIVSYLLVMLVAKRRLGIP
jgi:pyruvate,water dikinase